MPGYKLWESETKSDLPFATRGSVQETKNTGGGLSRGRFSTGKQVFSHLAQRLTEEEFENVTGTPVLKTLSSDGDCHPHVLSSMSPWPDITRGTAPEQNQAWLRPPFCFPCLTWVHRALNCWVLVCIPIPGCQAVWERKALPPAGSAVKRGRLGRSGPSFPSDPVAAQPARSQYQDSCLARARTLTRFWMDVLVARPPLGRCVWLS